MALVLKMVVLYKKYFFFSQIRYPQSASLLSHNLIAAIAAFPTHRFHLGGLEAGDFLNKVKYKWFKYYGCLVFIFVFIF